jgi:hypothetical protein
MLESTASHVAAAPSSGYDGVLLTVDGETQISLASSHTLPSLHVS